MNSFLGRCIAVLASIIVFILVWLPVGMLMAFGGYITFVGLVWGAVCFYAAKKTYKWIIYKALPIAGEEEIIHTDVLVGGREKNDIQIDSKNLKFK